MQGYNLLPWRELQITRMKKRFRMQWLGAVILTLSLLFIEYEKFSLRLAATDSHNRTLLANISMNKAKVQGVARMRNEIKSDATAMGFLKQLRVSQFKDVKLYRTLSHVTPPEVYLSRVSRENGEIILQGRAQSTAAVLMFIDKLRQEQLCKKIKLQEILYDEKIQDYQKQFSLALNGC